MTMVNIEYVLILTVAVDAVIDVNAAGCHGDELQNVILTWPVCLIKNKRPLYSLCLY